MKSQCVPVLSGQSRYRWFRPALALTVLLACVLTFAGCDGSVSQAHPVATRCEGEIFIEAPVQGTDVDTHILTLLDLAIRVNDRTRFDDVHLTGLAVGDFVEVHGFVTADGAVVATCLEREAGYHEVELRGPVDVDGIAAPRLFVLGIEIHTDVNTVFEDGRLRQATFFAEVRSDDLIEVEGRLQADGSIRADEIEFDDNDGGFDADDDDGGVPDDDDGDIDDDNDIDDDDGGDSDDDDDDDDGGNDDDDGSGDDDDDDDNDDDDD